MNMAQKSALGIGVVAIALMGLFPPWNLTVDLHSSSGSEIRSTNPAGYAPIYEPPKPPKDEWAASVYTLSVDASRLLFQWAIVAAVMGGLVLILGGKSNKPSRNRQSETGGHEPAIHRGQIESRNPTQSVGSVCSTDVFESQDFGPIISVPLGTAIAEKTAGIDPVESVPAYPDIGTRALPLPTAQVPSRPSSESERWPWPRVALWMYNWRTWLGFIGAFAILGDVSALGEFGSRAASIHQASESAVAAFWLPMVCAVGFTVAIVYAYVKLFTDPNRAARVLLCAYLASAVLGVTTISFGLFGELGWVALFYGVPMACLCRPLIRPRVARLAQLLNDLHRHGVPHSFMPEYGGGNNCLVKQDEPRTRLSLWKLYRQVVTGKVVLPDSVR